MIRIDLDEKLSNGKTRESFKKDYWEKVNYARQRSKEEKTIDYSGTAYPLIGDLDHVIEPFLALDGQDPLRQCLKILRLELAGKEGDSLAKRILLATPEQIRALVVNKELNHLINADMQANKAVKKVFQAIFDYKNGAYSAKIADCFNELAWSVCIYCGRNYISQIDIKDEKGETTKKRAYQLDHFHDKHTYPYLALSLFNLIPSCYFCNASLKGTKSLGLISPWSKDYQFNRDVTFCLGNDPDLLAEEGASDREAAKIILQRKTGCDYEALIQVLKIEEVYQLHAKQALDVAKKQKKYKDSHIKEMAAIADIDEKTMKRRIFEPLHHKDTSDKHPLSKLSHNIHKALGIEPVEDDAIRL